MEEELRQGHPYRAFIHQVERPARYVGGEYRSVVKPHVRSRFCLAFPDRYEIGMSHLGSKILYSLVNRDNDLAAERVFAPWFDMEDQLRRRRLPLLSLETARPLRDFDVVGFSLQYELTYTNLLNMLDLSDIPLRAQMRGEDCPLVIAGGPCAVNPETMAPFIDAFLIGDGERQLPVLLKQVADLKEAGVRREEILRRLAVLEGVYVPHLYETLVDPRVNRMVVGAPRVDGVPPRVLRTRVADLDRFPFPADAPEPWSEAIFDRMSVEIARGCTEGCRFCQAGFIYRPVRDRDPGAIMATILEAIDLQGYDEASLTSLSTADYFCISPLVRQLMAQLRPRHASLSVSSLRAYGLPEDLLDELASIRETGLTFAPEAGTRRLRTVINKNVDDEAFLATCHRVFSKGWSRIKLYFMIGLPTETEDDLEGIVDLACKARDIGRSYQRRAEVSVAVSTFVPKPHTPFQWCAMDPPARIEHKQQFLDLLARRRGLQLRVHDARMSRLEGILARSDRRAADLVEEAFKLGARFDGWDDQLRWDLWHRALESWTVQKGFDAEEYSRALPVDAPLPWDHVDVGVSRAFLVREYRRALEEKSTPPCAKPLKPVSGEAISAPREADPLPPGDLIATGGHDSTRLVCHHCGLDCDLREMAQRRARALETFEQAPVTVEPDGATQRDAAYLRFRKGLTPRSFDRGANARYRIRYHKLQSAALLGHLDLVRLLPRIFRRAGIRLCYSEGFHPQPEIAFGPALALGISSVAEIIEVRMMEEIDPAELLERLTGATPHGLYFTSARRIQDQERKLSRRLHAHDLLLTLAASDWAGSDRADDGRDRLAERCAAVMAMSTLEMPVMRQGREQVLDIRTCILDCRTIDPAQWPPELDMNQPAGLLLRIDLRGNGPMPQPRDLAMAVLGTEIPHADMARIGIWAISEDGLFEEP